MSTILADTVRKTGGTLGVDIRIKNSSLYESEGGTSVTQNIVQGLAKCWFLLEGDITTPVNRDSINSSSVTDHGTGDYTVTLTNNFSSSDNAFTGDAGYTQLVGGPYNASSYYYGSSSSRRVRSSIPNGTLYDCEQIGGSLFGDLV